MPEEVKLTDDLVSEDDLKFEVYGKSLKDHILQGIKLYEAIDSVLTKENIRNNSQLLDTLLFWANHLDNSVGDDYYEEGEKEAAYLQLLRSMSLLMSFAREMPESAFNGTGLQDEKE